MSDETNIASQDAIDNEQLLTLTMADKEYIQTLIDLMADSLKDFVTTLDANSLKIKIFDLMDYGFTNSIYAHNRYIAIQSDLMKDLEAAVFNNQFIVLRYGDVYWTLNSFQRSHLTDYSFSFITLMTDQDADGTINYSFPVIQFILITSNPNKDDIRNVIIKKSNTIKLCDKILTNNSIYEEDIFPDHSLDDKIIEFEEKTNLKV